MARARDGTSSWSDLPGGTDADRGGRANGAAPSARSASDKPFARGSQNSAPRQAAVAARQSGRSRGAIGTPSGNGPIEGANCGRLEARWRFAPAHLPMPSNLRIAADAVAEQVAANTSALAHADAFAGHR